MVALKEWLFFGVGYKLLDIVTTLYLISDHGPEVESNPFTANMMYAYGTAPGLILNGVIVSVLLYALYKHKRKKLLIISTMMMMLVVLVNTITILAGK
jgi:hypothetical protein